MSGSFDKSLSKSLPRRYAAVKLDFNTGNMGITDIYGTESAGFVMFQGVWYGCRAHMVLFCCREHLWSAHG